MKKWERKVCGNSKETSPQMTYHNCMLHFRLFLHLIKETFAIHLMSVVAIFVSCVTGHKLKNSLHEAISRWNFLEYFLLKFVHCSIRRQHSIVAPLWHKDSNCQYDSSHSTSNVTLQFRHSAHDNLLQIILISPAIKTCSSIRFMCFAGKDEAIIGQIKAKSFAWKVRTHASAESEKKYWYIMNW